MTELRDYQQRAITELRKRFRDRPLLCLPTGCHAPGQGVMRSDGTEVAIENVAVGDTLMGPGGSIRTVMNLCHGTGRLVRIVPVKGDSFIVNEDHMLTLVKTSQCSIGKYKSQRGGGIVDVKVSAYEKWSKYAKHIHKLFRTPAEFGSDPICSDMYRTLDPYFVGVMLGDGSLSSLSIHSEDPEIEQMCRDESERWGVSLRVSRDRCPSFSFTTGLTGGGSNPIREAFRAIGLTSNLVSENKFIPRQFRNAKNSVRSQVLAGLIDTDGSLARGGYDYISKSKTLAMDVAFIARSLGLAAYVSECSKTCQTGGGGIYFRVSISGECSIIPCRIARKVAPSRRQKKNHLRTGMVIEDLDCVGEYRGFTLDGDGRYLLSDFTVTHNSGKTSVASEIIRSATARGNRCVFLVHRRELVDQAVERLKQFGIRAGRILAGYPEKLQRAVQVASIPTLVRRKHWPAELVIVDECAHAVSDSWRKCLARYDGSWVIGLTATPIRLDGKGLGDMFGCIVEPVTTRELIDQGYLVEPTVYAPKIDLSGVHVRRGDYDLPELAERMSKLVGSITQTWHQRAHGMSTVVFAVNVAHSLEIVEAFRSMGVRAEHVDYKMAHGKRAKVLRDLREGRITMVSQVQLLSEGWDLPSLQCAILARPTKSLALFRQMVGRVVRPPGPVVVLDHAGNHHEHGMVTDDIEWTLKGIVKRPRDAEPVKSCGVCYAIIPLGAKECPECGAVPERAEADPPGVDNPGELVRIVTDGRKASMQDKQREYRVLVREANARSYKLAWARLKYKDRFGTWPRFRMIETENYTCPGHEWESKAYGPRTVRRCSVCYVESAR